MLGESERHSLQGSSTLRVTYSQDLYLRHKLYSGNTTTIVVLLQNLMWRTCFPYNLVFSSFPGKLNGLIP